MTDQPRWVPEDCPACHCRTFTDLDEFKPGGGLGPGDSVLCVNCKTTWQRPDASKERADAYYRNLIAMMLGARSELRAANEEHGEDSMEAATARGRLRSLLTTVESIEAGDYHMNCEACGKPLIDGQQVIYYDDAGDIHANCKDPAEASKDPQSHEYDSGFRPERCERELQLARAALADPD